MVTTVTVGVLVFLMAITVDAFFVMWSIAANGGRAITAALAATMIQVCAVMGTLYMVKEPWLLTLNAAGHGIGSYLAVKWTQRQKERDGVTQ